nr:gag pol polyprotein [Hymenolepis microstoma]
MFQLRGVTKSETWFQYAFTALPSNIRTQFKELTSTPPDNNSYDLLKRAVINRFSAPPETRLEQFFSTIELGDPSPSQLLSYMRSLACSLDLNDRVLERQWMNCLPFLITSPSREDLDKLAEEADLIHNHSDRSGVNAVKTSASTGTILQRLDILSDRLEELELLVADPPRRHSITPKRRRSPSRQDDQICYYHRTYGDKARRCRPTCKYAKSKSRSPSGKSHAPHRLLSVVDRNSKIKFLVDTGSEVSVISRSAEKRCLQATGISILSANNTKILTYGQKFLNLDLALRREFPFVFLIADFRKPIIGADFLSTFRLFVNLRDSSLHKDVISLQVIYPTQTLNSFSLNTLLLPANPFSNILSEFSSIFRAQTEILEPKHEVRHHITTKGQSVFASARCLHPDKLRAAKQECQHGILRHRSTFRQPVGFSLAHGREEKR